MKVHILATVRKPELLPAATLVFKTLRVGFPTAEIRVWGNSLSRPERGVIAGLCRRNNCHFHNFIPETCHDAWIDSIVNSETKPVWICDTDVVFWGKMEHFFEGSNELFCGRHEPQFHEEFTNTVRVERLHTAVMYINPPKLRLAIRLWMGQFPGPWGTTAQFPLIRQTFIPRMGQLSLFYDSTAGLYQAGMGTAFTDEQNDSFEHLHAGTYIDKVAEGCELGRQMIAVHRQIYSDYTLAKGLRRGQDQYLASKHV